MSAQSPDLPRTPPASPMLWIRRILSAPLLLLAFICLVGMLRMMLGNLRGSSAGEGVMVALFAAVAATAAFYLLRPDLRRLRGITRSDIRRWLLTNPIGQAVVLYVAAAVLMAAAPKASLLPGFAAQCAYSILAAWSAMTARRWWLHALLAVLVFVLLMGALAGTAEAVTPRGFGEGGMIFLLPMEGFPILLVLSGIARWVR